MLTSDPYQERAHQTLMRAYHQQGRRSLILRQYKQCQEVLRKDLDIEPSKETTDLYNQLMHSDSVSTGDASLAAPLARPALPSGETDSIIDRPVDSKPELRFRRYPFPKKPLLLNTLIVAVLITIWALLRNDIDTRPGAWSASPQRLENKDHTVKSIPRVAVLRFLDIGEDDPPSYFVSGLTEDLITELARLSGLEVIAPYSSFSFNDGTLEPGQIGTQLNARYLVRGSVQRSEGKLRVNASLVDASDGLTIWSERYDRPQSEILDLQDELTQAIATELSVKFTDAEQSRFDQVKSIDTDAYDLLLRGLEPLRQFTSDGLVEARRYFTDALTMDPNYARAHANIALTYGTGVVFRLTNSPEQDIDLAVQHIQDAEKINQDIPQVQFAKAVVNLAARNYEESIAASRRAISLEPSYADGHAVLAQTSSYAGDLDEALISIRQAKRLNPISPFSYLWVEAHVLYLMGRFEESKTILEEVVARNSSFVQGHLLLSAAYAQLGLIEESEWEREEVLNLLPDLSVADELKKAPYRLQTHRDLLADGLKKAGFRI